MNITRQANYIDGKWVYDPPLTPAEEAADAARFRDLCSARQAPGTMGTDRAFLEGHHSHGFTTEPEWMRNEILKKAKAAGVVTQGKKYVGGLADARGCRDPRAWVSDTGEAVKVMEERNLGSTGLIKRKIRESEPQPDIPLAEKHIQSIDRDKAREDPNWLRKPKQERREAIIDVHGAPAKRRGKRKIS